jgi:hypothetical protein
MFTLVRLECQAGRLEPETANPRCSRLGLLSKLELEILECIDQGA